VAALEACMTDDMVCGNDYFKCVDPTKKYIDENGEVVLGQDIITIRNFMKKYDASVVDSTMLSDAYAMTINDTNCKKVGTDTTGGDGSCTIKYLLQKIGTKPKVTEEGLCRAVLEKCQAYTYEDEEYKPYNDIVVNYVQRAMVNIRAAQNKIIADYASRCMVDVANCYNQQVTQVNSWSSSASVDSVFKVMFGACYNVSLTCAYAVFADTRKDGATPQSLIGDLSEIFYQSLLCPENSTFSGEEVTSTHTVANGWVNARCKCNTGYDVWTSTNSCIAACTSGKTHNSITGVCE